MANKRTVIFPSFTGLFDLKTIVGFSPSVPLADLYVRSLFEPIVCHILSKYSSFMHEAR